MAKATRASSASRSHRLDELFCGAGEWRWVRLAKTKNSRFSFAWANDIDENACRTFRRNLFIDEDAAICGDVSRVDFDDLPSIDGLAFGFPCNDFSPVGERNGTTGRYGEMHRWGICAWKPGNRCSSSRRT